MTFRLWSWMLLLALFVPAFARAEEASADSSMPQLDPTYYMSQLFWLILCGATLYWLMDKVALPRVSRMVDLRDDQVRRDLELAYKLKQQAEDVKVDYTRALRDADDNARSVIDGMVKDLKTTQEKSLAEAVDRFNQQVLKTEIYLRGEKDVLLRDLKVYADNLAKMIVTELKNKQAA